MKEVLIDIKTLALRNGQFELSIENLCIRAGETVALIGHNGAGKTTLLLALAGLIKPHKLHCIFEGHTITDFRQMSGLRKSITMLFQEPLLLNATVSENIALGLKMRKIPHNEIMRKVHESASMLGITHLLHRRAYTLSAGEARRVSLARALVLKPKLLLMDEPFSSLDNMARDSILEDFSNILNNTQCSVLFVSHDRDEALRLADRIVVLGNGRIIQEGTPTEIIDKPADEFTASFMGVETILTGKVVDVFEGGFFVDVAGKMIEVSGVSQVNDAVTIGIRPEHVVISHGKKSSSSMRNSFEGRVVDITHAGSHVRISLDCGFKLIAFITPHSLQELKLTKGNAVTASFKATAIHVLRSWNG